MDITREFVDDAIARMYRRCEAARSAGGMPAIDVLRGATVPAGWRFDEPTRYWLPPNVTLL
jgi:hypothetical protein